MKIPLIVTLETLVLSLLVIHSGTYMHACIETFVRMIFIHSHIFLMLLNMDFQVVYIFLIRPLCLEQTSK